MILVTLLISTFASVSLLGPLAIIGRVNAGNISYDLDSSTKLDVTVQGPFPRILWYDFQQNTVGTTWVSRLNQRIDVDNTTKYRFVVNVSSDYGWRCIEYINITAWFDNGSESTTYNKSGNQGGNRNMLLQYKNTQTTNNVSQYNLLWPKNGGITKRLFTEVTRRDPAYGASGCENRNLTFEFIPGYQFRCAKGNGTWMSGRHLNQSSVYDNGTWWWAYNNNGSWNFNISVVNNVSRFSRNSFSTWACDEFGVYTYSAIVSVGSPSIIGIPGATVSSDAITITTRSNGNYSLSVNMSNLTHIKFPAYTISNETVKIRGGNLTTPKNFTAHAGDAKQPIYLYGNVNATGIYQYLPHEAHGNQKVTGTNSTESYTRGFQTTNSSLVVYTCNIPLGSSVGTYRSTIRYNLETQE